MAWGWGWLSWKKEKGERRKDRIKINKKAPEYETKAPAEH
jgi:hypothetical protein